jgi:hypothetical protein
MHIIQPRQVAPLECEPCFAKIEPHLATNRMVQAVDPSGSLRVETLSMSARFDASAASGGELPTKW